MPEWGGMNRIDAESETLVACDVADTLTIGANQTTGFFGDGNVVATIAPPNRLHVAERPRGFL